MSQLIGEGLKIGFEGLIAMGLIFFLHSLWRDVSQLFSGKDCE